MKSVRVLAILAAALALTLAGATATAESRTTWAGMYFGVKKMGYTRVVTDRATFRGKPATSINTYTLARIELMGNKVSQDIETTSYTSSSGALLHQRYKMSSGGAVTIMTADTSPARFCAGCSPGGQPPARP